MNKYIMYRCIVYIDKSTNDTDGKFYFAMAG